MNLFRFFLGTVFLALGSYQIHAQTSMVTIKLTEASLGYPLEHGMMNMTCNGEVISLEYNDAIEVAMKDGLCCTVEANAKGYISNQVEICKPTNNQVVEVPMTLEFDEGVIASSSSKESKSVTTTNPETVVPDVSEVPTQKEIASNVDPEKSTPKKSPPIATTPKPTKIVKAKTPAKTIVKEEPKRVDYTKATPSKLVGASKIKLEFRDAIDNSRVSKARIDFYSDCDRTRRMGFTNGLGQIDIKFERKKNCVYAFVVDNFKYGPAQKLYLPADAEGTVLVLLDPDPKFKKSIPPNKTKSTTVVSSPVSPTAVTPSKPTTDLSSASNTWIRGGVKSNSGVAIPNAKLTIASDCLGAPIQGQSGPSGEIAIELPLLDNCTYAIRCQADGFGDTFYEFTKKNINRFLGVIPLKLEMNK